MSISPRAAPERTERRRSPGPGPGERFAEYGVTGLPLRSGTTWRSGDSRSAHSADPLSL